MSSYDITAGTLADSILGNENNFSGDHFNPLIDEFKLFNDNLGERKPFSIPKNSGNTDRFQGSVNFNEGSCADVNESDVETNPNNDENKQNSNKDSNDNNNNNNNNRNNNFPTMNNIESDQFSIEDCEAVTKMDILHYLINSLSGKDKIAKIIKYTLDLLNYYIVKLNRSKRIQFLLKLNRYRLFRNKINPIIKYISLFLKRLEKKISFISIQLGTYRYILRFGSSPFLLMNMFKKYSKLWNLQQNNTSDMLSKVIKFSLKTISEQSFKEMINIYFSVCDEMMLLHRLGVWSNKQLSDVISRQEVYTWQIDILLNLKGVLLNLNDIKNKELKYHIERDVREKTIESTRSLYNNNRPNINHIRTRLYKDFYDNNDFNGQESKLYIDALSEKLENSKYERSIAHLDLIRLLFDLTANSTDFFKIRISSASYSSLSICSGVAGLIKLWLLAKRNLAEQRELQD